MANPLLATEDLPGPLVEGRPPAPTFVAELGAGIATANRELAYL